MRPMGSMVGSRPVLPASEQDVRRIRTEADAHQQTHERKHGQKSRRCSSTSELRADSTHVLRVPSHRQRHPAEHRRGRSAHRLGEVPRGGDPTERLAAPHSGNLAQGGGDVSAEPTAVDHRPEEHAQSPPSRVRAAGLREVVGQALQRLAEAAADGHVRGQQTDHLGRGVGEPVGRCLSWFGHCSAGEDRGEDRAGRRRQRIQDQCRLQPNGVCAPRCLQLLPE